MTRRVAGLALAAGKESGGGAVVIVMWGGAEEGNVHAPGPDRMGSTHKW